MEIERALSRFTEVMSARWPTQFAQLQPGLDDDGIQALRDAVSPFLVPDQVESLYRWRNGGDDGIFGGWSMSSVEQLLTWYRFTCDELESPRTWLPVFAAQMVNVVTLDVPGFPPSDPSVWYGHTHDADVSRLFDSVADLLDVVSDAAEAGLLADSDGLGLGVGEDLDALDGLAWDPLRLARCPSAFRWPDAPAGTHLCRFPDPAWPTEWLAGVGVAREDLAPRGATHTVAQLVAAAVEGPVQGTIRGQVVTGSGGPGWWSPVVDDGTGQIVVSCDTRAVPVAVNVGEVGEFDVVLASAEAPDPIVDDDELVAQIANRFRPSLPNARAIGARPVVDG